MAGGLIAIALGGCDPASVYGPLAGQWTAQTNGPIAAKPAVGDGTAYVGSWDGKEYAFKVTSGAVTWRSDLGQTQADCGGTTYTQGVTSSPWLQGGLAYLGGGGSTWDALSTSTGRVLWTVYTGENTPSGGHYNWSSPVVYHGHAYVGIASFCDQPLVQGELLRVNLTTHRTETAFKVTPDGHVGGGIWTNPVLDPATNTVFVATGNGDRGERYAQSIVALDATTLAVRSKWSLPHSDPTIDPDFSTSPVLFTDSRGRALVAVSHKNGILYAFRRSSLGAGPVWQTRIAASVNACTCGGSFSTGFFDGTRLVYAGGRTAVGGHAAGGSVRAINPNTGAFLWEHALPAQVYGALAGADGMVAVPSSNGGLYVVRGTDGAVLYANSLAGAPGAPAIFGAPTIADGYLFIGTTDGVVHAFKFPRPSLADHARARAADAQNRPHGADCAVTPGLVLKAECRLLIGGGTRCARLGQLPAEIGAVTVDGLTARAGGPGTTGPATVSFYTDGSCAGRQVARVRIVNGYGTARFGPPLTLPPETVSSLLASRPLRLDVHVVGHSRRVDPPAGGFLALFSRR